MSTKAEKIADVAGPLGAVFAALCCLGVPFIVAGLAAIGLSILRADPILWPLMIVSLIVALWGMRRGWRTHGSAGPFVIALLSGIALVAGVIFVHGFPARELIYGGSAGLLAATVWNVSSRVRCERRLRRAAI
jgi:mercuric ion transport protein